MTYDVLTDEYKRFYKSFISGDPKGDCSAIIAKVKNTDLSVDNVDKIFNEMEDISDVLKFMLIIIDLHDISKDLREYLNKYWKIELECIRNYNRQLGKYRIHPTINTESRFPISSRGNGRLVPKDLVDTSGSMSGSFGCDTNWWI